MKVLTVAMQKGGVGKSCSSHNIGAALTLKGFKVLLIDADAQGNLSTSAGINTLELEHTLYEVLKGETDIHRAIIHTAAGYDILPTAIRQSVIDIEFLSVPGRELLLKHALEPLQNQYDFVVIDTPPALGISTLMSLTAATHVVIPVQAQFFALQGLKQLTETIDAVKRTTNPGLNVVGVFMTMYDSRKNLDTAVLNIVKQVFPDKLLQTMIPSNVALAAAAYHGKDIFAYEPESKGAQQYTKLTEEILSIL